MAVYINEVPHIMYPPLRCPVSCTYMSKDALARWEGRVFQSCLGFRPHVTMPATRLRHDSDSFFFL